MEPFYKTLPLDYHPQRNEFRFDEIKISSNFDSGNLLNIQRINENIFNFYISQDCYGTTQEYCYRTWFYFGIYGVNNRKLTLSICNMNNQTRIFQEGYKIVYRKLAQDNIYYNEESYMPQEELIWKRLETEIKFQPIGDDRKQIQISFDFHFEPEDEKGVLFSFCYPWSYLKNQKFLEYLELEKFNSKTNDIYYNREVLTYSKEMRQLDLITISSFDNIRNTKELALKNLFPFNNKCTRSNEFSKDKPIVFITARVHPGETSSSYLMNGIIKFLIDNRDPRSYILRKFFVFKLIPIINVDGVSRGYYRYDTNSLNMNRHYINPDPKIQPEIYAIRRLFMYYSQEFKVRYYFDLHGHVSSKGVFLFGNSLDFLSQVENCLLPKLIEINCELFNYDNCNFKEKSMKSQEKGDKNSKEGTGRVYFNKSTDIIHSYTVEASYFRGLIKNKMIPIYKGYSENMNSLSDYIIQQTKQIFNAINSIRNDSLVLDYSSDLNFYENSLVNIFHNDELNFYTPICYEKIGIAIIVSILDYEELNPFSRLFNTEFGNVQILRKFISNKILKEDDKYKFNIINHNLNKDINRVKNFVSLQEKISNFNKKKISEEGGAKVMNKNNSSISKHKVQSTHENENSKQSFKQIMNIRSNIKMNTETAEKPNLFPTIVSHRAEKSTSVKPFKNLMNIENPSKKLKEKLSQKKMPIEKQIKENKQINIQNCNIAMNILKLKGNILERVNLFDNFESKNHQFKNKTKFNDADESISIKKFQELINIKKI